MVMITLLNLQKRFSCLERRGVFTRFYQCCSQQEKIVDKASRQDSEDYLNSDHTSLYFFIGSNLHFVAFIRYTHLENISIALVDISYR